MWTELCDAEIVLSPNRFAIHEFYFKEENAQNTNTPSTYCSFSDHFEYIFIFLIQLFDSSSAQFFRFKYVSNIQIIQLIWYNLNKKKICFHDYDVQTLEKVRKLCCFFNFHRNEFYDRMIGLLHLSVYDGIKYTRESQCCNIHSILILIYK